MTCPCGSRTRVQNTSQAGPLRIRRLRKCGSCGAAMVTVETVVKEVKK